MTTFAPPVRKGSFLYSSILYADAGSQNHHPRASVAELTALLRPEAPKLNKKLKIPQPPEILKDQDKNAAKVRLLSALNEGRLEVPGWVTKVEGELKKEWETENRRLKKGEGKKEGKSKAALASETLKASQGKRKREDVGKLKNVESSKKVKKEEPKPGRETTKAKPQESKKKIKVEEPKAARATPVKKARVKKESIKEEPFVQRIKSEPVASDFEREDMVFTGTYTVMCPTVSELCSEPVEQHRLQLSLLRDDERGVWWSRFFWYSWECVIQMNPGPTFSTLGQPCTLGWRLRDTRSGQMWFGRGKTGEMVFDHDYTIRGTLFNVPFVDTLEFWGRRIPGPKYVGRSGSGFQFEWDGFANAAYRN
ncbi:hypothetical protein M011DRAFT_474878 [Sporormia fimetaria CBS 119925]|uniref:Uncharacterized protein n=1 Tax=Sporormia fimetaria CBS 119925 TaxID=1340428 RepID=A0A6A6VLK8_9PLEO|nr:hypothetical protein M011DRAFT_474878 [Sporormia fimetaria CBS 119925]